MSRSFLIDRANGKERERQFARALEAKGLTNVNLTTDLGEFQDYDISATIPDIGTVTFEVKLDRYFGKKSPFIAVEVGKTINRKYSQSGIHTSKAMFTAYTFATEPGVFYIINTEELRTMHLSGSWERIVDTHDSETSIYHNILMEGEKYKALCKRLKA